MAPTQQQGSSASSTDNCYNSSASSVNTNTTTESKSNFSSSINKSQSFSSNSSSSSLNNSSSSALHNSNDLNNSCKEKNNAFDQHLLNFGSSTNLATILPVTTRGPFYHDTFFQDTRQHYDSAVREVLDNWGQRSELDDDLTTYRKLREVDLTDASQATTVSEDDTHHQVVMDVVDFPRECVRVKVVDENELVVEGSVDQREGTSTSTKSFCRRFTFPGLVRPAVVTSTISSDGVLTITVPKKVCGKREIAVKEETVKTKTHKLENSHKLTDTTSMNSNTTKRNAFDCSKIKEEDKSRTQKNVSMHKTKETSVTSEDTLNKEQKSATNEATTNPLLNSSNQLPITSKGDFFHDSHFAHVREDFEAAVQRVLKSWNETSEDDVMTSYRNLRTRDLKEDNQAVSLTEDAKQHKVVLDVHDFPRECVKVKVVDENELVVEGSVDQREGTSTSTKSFCRRFTFPGLVRSEVVTSTMSSDGVLTITVPKKICDKREIAVNEETVKTKPQQLKNSQKKTDTTSTNNNTAKRDSFDCSKEEKSQTQKKVSYQKTKETSVGSEDTSDNQQKTATNEATTNLLLNSSNQLPITSKGDFFQDSHFAHVREDFEAAVQRVLKSWNETSEDDDVMTSYRNLRTRDLKEDNQAVSLTEDVKQHKVVLDVHDFPRECVKVKVVDENELVVEGSVDQREGTSTSTKSFCRRFTFPGLVRSEVVTSTMSSDGVLTITVPKKICDKREIAVNEETVKTKPQQLKNSQKKTDTTSTNNNTAKRDSFDCSKEEKSQTQKKVSYQKTKEASVGSEDTSDNQQKTATNEATTNLLLNSSNQLPITSKGDFFQDSHFAHVREDFEAAVQRVLKSWNETSEDDDVMTSYRNLRTRDLKEDNQAVSLTEDVKQHKVVLDVHDFPRECVKVKVVDENELVVEGSVDQREGTSTSTKSFCHRFTFPGLVRSEVVTSTMSSDGVLTITVPKKICDKREIAVNEETVKTKPQQLKNSQKKTDTTSTNNNTAKRDSFDCSKEEKSQTQKNVSYQKTKETSVGSEDTSANQQKSATNEATTNLLNSSNQLPITSKGDFFQDSHFAHVREDFEAAVQRVLKSWNANSEDDVMTSYRNLRTRYLNEDNQAVSLTEDAKQHRVVLDVHDFPRECVRVKVVDENELVVEGSVDQREGTSTSTKSFCRRFTFPGLVRSEVVTSTMSSDGVLTITVPKKICDKREIAVNEETVKTKPQQLKNSQKKTDTTSTINDTAKRDSFDCSKEEKSQTQKKVSYQKTKETSVGSEDTSDNQQKSATNEATINLLNSSNQLPITSKGDFFQDSHFAHVREDFEAAVQRVLKSWNETSEDDVMTSYRNLRTRDLKEDNQAVSLTEDAKQHKVVLDVHDFPRECVRVKVVDENELVVEGSVDQREGTSTSTKSFCRRFTFPGLVRPEVVTSTMSSDGVLTITVPKKESSKEQELNMKTTTTNSNRNVSTENSLKDQVNLKNALSDSADTQTSTSNSYSSISNMSREYSSQVTEEMKKSSASVDDHLSSTATIGSESFLPEDSLLSVDKKGLFFHDDFFQNARQDYESAINEVLTRFSLTQPASDDLSTYRSLRQTDFGDESQAMKVTEVQDTHKVVMDVRDFMKGDIKVKMVGEKEVEVDGVVVEEKEGANKSTRRFNRRVHLPDMVDVEAVTSAMSSDGVLTITAPKVVKK